MNNELIHSDRQLHTCSSCGSCLKGCPMLSRHCKSPNDLFKQPERLSAWDSIVPFSCTLCGYCEQVCPQNISLKQHFHALKRQHVRALGYPARFGKVALDFHQKQGRAPLFSTQVKPSTRSDFEGAKGDRTGTASSKTSKHRVFFPGCNMSSYNPRQIQQVYQYLQSSAPTDILLKCCGSPSRTVGLDQQYGNMREALQKDFMLLEATEVVVLCMNCHKTLSMHYPDVQVRTIWEVMRDEGLPITKTMDLQLRHGNAPHMALHDPCPTRYHHDVHDAVRYVADTIGLHIEEFENSRSKTLCCGSGAMLPLVDKGTAQAHMKKRAEQANASHILTYCGECVSAMQEGGKPSIHLLDMVFPSDPAWALTGTTSYNRRKKNGLVRWFNRFVTKVWVDWVRRRFVE